MKNGRKLQEEVPRWGYLKIMKFERCEVELLGRIRALHLCIILFFGSQRELY